MLEHLALTGLRKEALRIAQMNGVDDMDGVLRIEAALRVGAYKCAIQPYVALKVRLLAPRMPRRIVIHDGEVQAEFEPLPPEAQKLMDALDEMIRAEAIRFGLSRDRACSPAEPAPAIL